MSQERLSLADILNMYDNSASAQAPVQADFPASAQEAAIQPEDAAAAEPTPTDEATGSQAEVVTEQTDENQMLYVLRGTGELLFNDTQALPEDWPVRQDIVTELTTNLETELPDAPGDAAAQAALEMLAEQVAEPDLLAEEAAAEPEDLPEPDLLAEEAAAEPEDAPEPDTAIEPEEVLPPSVPHADWRAPSTTPAQVDVYQHSIKEITTMENQTKIPPHLIVTSHGEYDLSEPQGVQDLHQEILDVLGDVEQAMSRLQKSWTSKGSLSNAYAELEKAAKNDAPSADIIKLAEKIAALGEESKSDVPSREELGRLVMKLEGARAVLARYVDIFWHC